MKRVEKTKLETMIINNLVSQVIVIIKWKTFKVRTQSYGWQITRVKRLLLLLSEKLSKFTMLMLKCWLNAHERLSLAAPLLKK